MAEKFCKNMEIDLLNAPANVHFGTCLPGGDSSFRVIFKERKTFVDKSLFIAEVIDTSYRVNLILRPRRFGKSLNLSMLKTFFDLGNHESNRILFQDLLIAKHRPELFGPNGRFGRHPVVFLDLKGLKAGTWNDMIDNIRILLADVYTQFEYLMHSPKLNQPQKEIFRRIWMLDETVKTTQLQNSLKKLTEYLTRHHGEPCVVLVDEYDTPLESAHQKKYFEDARDFFGAMFSALLKGNDENIYKAVLVGVLRVAKSDFLSGLNNLMVYTFKNRRFSDKFGFSSQEVGLLLEKHQPGLDVMTVKAWYNGYQSAEGLEVFNPCSVIGLCSEGDIQNFWVDTGSTTTITPLLKSRGSSFRELVSGLLGDKIGQVPTGITLKINDSLRYDSLQSNIEDEDVWTLLYFAGYLAVRNDGKYYIPNMEVSFEWLSWVLPNVHVPKSFQSIIKILLCGDIPEFARLLPEIIISSFSYYDVGGPIPGSISEAFYHAFVLGLLFSGRDSGYDIESNREAGTGRFDLVLRPQRHLPPDALGIIIEFKVASESEEVGVAATRGLGQIRDKNYRVRCSDLENICEIGIGFKGKLCSVVGERLKKIAGSWHPV
ncbi:hypothetical protein BDR26DRAFT_855819 [Obelidium mucronatum]|nr:hypothetical protein BDR26DRAFT_855819 [Obelidium mucronatum]